VFQTRTSLWGGRAQWTLAAVVFLAGLTGGASAIGTPVAYAASAGPVAGPLCEGFSACNVAPYTTHNFQNGYTTSYWGMPPDQDTAPSGAWANCTNYVAFVESRVYGVPTPKPALPVNAMNWAAGARKNGFTVNQTPTVGSVAQWSPDLPVIGPDGHVAVVEAVGPKDSYIVVSQDNWSSDTDYYGWALILAGSASPNEPWPDNFIHFRSTGLPTTLSYAQPNRLVQSTGNLYWTANQTLDGTSYAGVIRASKGNQPGQERTLYQQAQGAASQPVDFEAITYADVGGSWYGYFVANYPVQDESEIMRVPLIGGAAVMLANSPAFIGNRDLVTDGSFLYWADVDGIRKIGVAGGPLRTLVSGGSFAHLGLDGPVLYFSSGDSIMRVPTSGGSPITVVSLASAVTAIYPPSATNGNIYWGEANGSVSLFPGPRGSVYQLQAPGAGVSVTSVSLGGNYILWGERTPDGYKVDGYDNGNVVSVPASGPPVDVQGDAGAWYWGDSDLEKFAP
jgi:surface antigen